MDKTRERDAAYHRHYDRNMAEMKNTMRRKGLQLHKLPTYDQWRRMSADERPGVYLGPVCRWNGHEAWGNAVRQGHNHACLACRLGQPPLLDRPIPRPPQRDSVRAMEWRRARRLRVKSTK